MIAAIIEWTVVFAAVFLALELHRRHLIVLNLAGLLRRRHAYMPTVFALEVIRRVGVM